jgi:hypothetical protein
MKTFWLRNDTIKWKREWMMRRGVLGERCHVSNAIEEDRGRGNEE